MGFSDFVMLMLRLQKRCTKVWKTVEIELSREFKLRGMSILHEFP